LIAFGHDTREEGSFMRLLRNFSLFVMFLSALSAQDFRAALTGIVTDPSGAAVVGARVKAVNTTTNATADAVTNEAGRYSIAFLIPGKYSVEIEAAGFKKIVRDNVQLQINSRSALDVALELGGVNEKITVSTEISRCRVFTSLPSRRGMRSRSMT
jgi:hypothetical protein